MSPCHGDVALVVDAQSNTGKSAYDTVANRGVAGLSVEHEIDEAIGWFVDIANDVSSRVDAVTYQIMKTIMLAGKLTVVEDQFLSEEGMHIP